jgi:hypothetical protein
MLQNGVTGAGACGADAGAMLRVSAGKPYLIA